MASTTWIKWYPADWRSDPCLRQCSLAARGLWIELLGFMHEADPYGLLLINGKKPTNAEIARLVGIHHHAVTPLLTELVTHGVTSELPSGVIYSRRMVRDYKKYLQHKANGQKGGNPKLLEGVKPQIPDTRNQIPERKNPPTPQRGRRAQKVSIPPDFQITAERAKVAAILGLDAHETFNDFRQWHEMRPDYRLLPEKWDVRWGQWCENQKRFPHRANLQSDERSYYDD